MTDLNHLMRQLHGRPLDMDLSRLEPAVWARIASLSETGWLTLPALPVRAAAVGLAALVGFSAATASALTASSPDPIGAISHPLAPSTILGK